VFKRLFVLSAALLVAGLLAAGALAAVVHVRVEGKNTTIFGTTEPRASGANALEVLESASLAGEFYYHVTTTSFGPYVDQIGRYAGSESSGWVFKVNGVSPPVGADKVELKDGDQVLWYYAAFGPSGGPPTLSLAKGTGACYRVSAQDDAGKAVSTDGVFLQVDARIVKTSGGVGCPGKHRGLVRAVKGGYVRSNSLP
jgi:Domain of unknown function (DUF4430)